MRQLFGILLLLLLTAVYSQGNQVAPLGSCTATAECVSNAMCIGTPNGVCSCTQPYAASTDGQTCAYRVYQENTNSKQIAPHDCFINIDECASNPCVNGGTCFDLQNRFVCGCVNGYEDTTCSTDTNECASNPCLFESTCNDFIGYYNCTCTPGYSGYNCDKDIDECLSLPCQNGGTCVDFVNYFGCECQAGYIDTTCRQSVLYDYCPSSADECAGILNAACNGAFCVCVTGYKDYGNATCRTVDCGAITNKVSGGSATAITTTYGSTAIVYCNIGYENPTPSTITCLDSGLWSTASCFIKANALGESCLSPSDANVLPGELCSDMYAECLAISTNSYTCQCVTGYYDDNGNIEAGKCRPVDELQVQHLSLLSVTSSSMLIAWTPPTMKEDFISGYVVEWRQKDSFVSSGTSGTLSITSYLINPGNLISGRTYIVKVFSKNTVNYTFTEQSTNVEAEQALKPQTPGSISTQSSDLDASDNNIQIVWTASSGYVDMYEVCLIEDGIALRCLTSTLSTINITHSEIENGHRYNVSINALSEIIAGSYHEKSDTHTEEIKTVVKVPSEPRFVRCHLATVTTITISWNASLKSNGDFIEYRIYTHSYVNGYSVKNDSTYAINLKYEIINLQPGSYYYFYVSTVNEEYESGPTRLYDNFCATLANVAGAPNNFVVSNIQSRTIMVSWTKPTNTFGEHMGYVIQVWTSDDQCMNELIMKCTDCTQTFEISALKNMCAVEVSTEEPLSKTTIDSVDSMNYTVTSLNPDITYNVSVTAVNGAGKGILDSVTIQTDEEVPQKPKEITILDITPTSCTVNWNIDGPRPGSTIFDVIISPVSPAVFDNIQLTGFDIRSKTLTGLEEFWDYNVTIRAKTAKGSIESDTIIFQTLPAAPGIVDGFEVITARSGEDYTKFNVKWKIPVLLERNSEIVRFALFHNTSKDANYRTLILDKIPDTAYVYNVMLNVTPGDTYAFKVYSINAENENGTEAQKIVTAPSAEESEEDGGLNVIIICIVVAAAILVLLTIVVVTKWVLRRRKTAKIAQSGCQINDVESDSHRNETRRINSATSAPITSKMSSDEILAMIHINIFSNSKEHIEQNTGEHIVGLSQGDFQHIFGPAEGVCLFKRLGGREYHATAEDPMNDETMERADVPYENIKMDTINL